jgi:hypothetical protein
MREFLRINGLIRGLFIFRGALYGSPSGCSNWRFKMLLSAVPELQTPRDGAFILFS